MTSSAAASSTFRPATLEALLARVANAARASGAFGEISIVSTGKPGPSPSTQGDATGGAGGGIPGLPMLRCEAKASAEPAFYAIRADFRDANDHASGTCLWVSLQTGARYLSQSIEADLMFTGDKIDDLVHEEMTDLGYDGPALPFQHFRSEDKLYTFRSPLAITPADITSAASLLDAAKLCEQALRGYEAAFVGLGDMEDVED